MGKSSKYTKWYYVRKCIAEKCRILSIILILFSILFSLNTLDIIGCEQCTKIDSGQVNNAQDEDRISIREYELLNIRVSEINNRIDNIYMWAIVFASLLVAIGLYQVYSTRKVAEDIAIGEMKNMREDIETFQKEVNKLQDDFFKVTFEKFNTPYKEEFEEFGKDEDKNQRGDLDD